VFPLIQGIMKHEQNVIFKVDHCYKIEELRYFYAQKGLERSKRFSWEKSANEHIEIYKKIINN
jgi:glycosyltransferase involved in cell wall biosynthesis